MFEFIILKPNFSLETVILANLSTVLDAVDISSKTLPIESLSVNQWRQIENTVFRSLWAKMETKMLQWLPDLIANVIDM